MHDAVMLLFKTDKLLLLAVCFLLDMLYWRPALY
jgi:hypothetical protein